MLAPADRCEALVGSEWWCLKLPRRCLGKVSAIRQDALVCTRHAALVDHGGQLIQSMRVARPEPRRTKWGRGRG